MADTRYIIGVSLNDPHMNGKSRVMMLYGISLVTPC